MIGERTETDRLPQLIVIRQPCWKLSQGRLQETSRPLIGPELVMRPTTLQAV
jgi:hypothetical protein